MNYQDRRGVPITAASRTSVERFEQVLDQYLSFRGDPMAALDTLLVDDPDRLQN